MAKMQLPQPKALKVRRLARKWRAGIRVVNASGRCTDRIAHIHFVIHSKLIDELDTAQESDCREEIEEIIELSKPWGDLRAAMKAPPRLVNDLLNRQQAQIEQLTGKDSKVARLSLIVAMAVFVFIICLIFIPVLADKWRVANVHSSSLTYMVSSFFRRIVFSLKQTSFEQRTAVFAFVVVVLGGWLLTRPGRS